VLALELPKNNLPPDFEAVIAWPPSVNNYWRTGVQLPSLEAIQSRVKEHGWGSFWKWLRSRTRTNTFLGKRGQIYREAVAWQLIRSRGKFGGADIIVEITLRPPTKAAPDIDNFNKAIFDALEHAGIFENDRQICQLLETRAAPVRGGEVEVRIWRSRAR
jgi:crossover junction endodeoxyribonuclease RusA